MRTWLIAGVSLAIVSLVSIAHAAEMPTKAPISKTPTLATYNWTGWYFGPHIGAMWGTTDFSDPFGSSIYGDDVRQPAFLGGAQLGFNWQPVGSHWIFGIEADASLLDSVGTNTCLAYSGYFLSANCRNRPNATATLTGRLGIATGPQNRTLYYVKGGAAAIHDRIDIAINGLDAPSETSSDEWRWGWTVGAGVERSLTPAWSLRFEYDYLHFGGNDTATPASSVQTAPPAATYAATSGATTSVSHDLHQVKLALNYHFGADPWKPWPATAYAAADPAAVSMGGWEVEAGVRYWYSWGRFQKDLASSTDSSLANVLNSRLTYLTTTNSGEVFGRIESPINVFVKGFVGAGNHASGHLNDEDWLIFFGTVPYSNTLSDPVEGSIRYATIDAGYDFIRTPQHRLGAFVGYNYYKENKDAYGCVQIANRYSDCVPSLSSSVLGITENDTWKSLRVGLNGEMMLLPRVKLGVDVAYLPYVKLDGEDIHHLRNVANQTSPETGTGRGVQLEAILSYYLTPAFIVGVGGRYWAMWTDDDAYTNIFGTPCPCQPLPSKTERYGAFFQASYRFGGAKFADSKH